MLIHQRFKPTCTPNLFYLYTSLFFITLCHKIAGWFINISPHIQCTYYAYCQSSYNVPQLALLVIFKSGSHLGGNSRSTLRVEINYATLPTPETCFTSGKNRVCLIWFGYFSLLHSSSNQKLLHILILLFKNPYELPSFNQICMFLFVKLVLRYAIRLSKYAVLFPQLILRYAIRNIKKCSCKRQLQNQLPLCSVF